MKFFSEHNCVIVFLLVLFIARPISFDEVQERKLARLHKDRIEVVNVPSQSVGQPFLSNVKPSTINDSLNSYSHDEYDYLMGGENDLILAAFQGKILLKYHFTIDSNNNNNRLNADLRIIKKDRKNPENELDVTASIPEEKVLGKLYQIKPFGVNVPKEVDLNFARELPTKPRLEYLDDKVGIKTVKDAHNAFAKYLDDDDTDVFFDKFGEKYDTEDSDVAVYDGFYVFNSKNRNMMFFREQKTGIPYKLHSYMKLSEKKAAQLKKNHQLFD